MDVQKQLEQSPFPSFPDKARLKKLLSTEQINQLQACQTLEKLIEAFMSCFDVVKDKAESIEFSSFASAFIDIDYGYSAFLKNTLIQRLILANLTIELKNRARSIGKKDRRVYIRSCTSNLDIRRAISGDPCCFIKTIEPTQKSEASKIIINIPLLGALRGIETLFDLLDSTTGLDLYIFYQGKIVPFKDISAIARISSADIRKVLSEQHKNIQDYYILDYSEWNDILKKSDVLQSKKVDNLKAWSSKLHINAEVNSNEADIEFFVNNIGDDGVILSTDGSHAAMNETTRVLGQLGNQEKLTIANLHGIRLRKYQLTFPKGAEKLKSLTVNLWNCCQFNNLSHLASVESIALNCGKLTELDLSGLKYVKQVKISGTSVLKHMQLNSAQKNIIFDFSEATISRETKKMIQHLEEHGITIHWTDHLDSSSLDLFFAASGISPNPPQYDETPKGLPQETGHRYTELTQTISLINHEGNIDARDYRKKIITSIQMLQDKLVFTPFVFCEEKAEPVDLTSIEMALPQDFNKNMAQALHEKVAGSYLGVIALCTDNPNWVPLTSLSVNDCLVCLQELVDSHLTLEIRYANETQQYFVRLLQKGKSAHKHKKEVNLHYAMSPDKKNTLYQAESASLPDDLAKCIDAFLKLEMILEPVNDIEQAQKSIGMLGIYQKNKKLIDGLHYFCCQCFSEKEISTEIKDYVEVSLLKIGIKNASINHFMSVLFANAGACDHRAKVFLALAHYFKIPAHVNHNDVHASVEYFADNQWKQMDLGGGHVETIHSIDAWKEPVESVAFIESTPEQKQIDDIPDTVPFTKNFCVDKLVLDDVNQLSAVTTDEKEKGFQGWYNMLLRVPGNPLLQFQNKQDAFELHSHLMQLEDHHLGDNYFYIHHPSDFERLLTQLEVRPDGQCHQIKGPLLIMIEKGSGTLLINWSHFSEKQIANYKSILDSRPTLQGYTLSPTTKIINITEPSTKACAAFYSRTKKIAWPEKLGPVDIKKSQVFESIQKEAIDLYQSRDWESLLIGKLQIKGDSYAFKEGALLNALKQHKTSICLTGLPDRNAFNVFLERLQRERGFYANGAFYRLPDNFTIQFSPTPESQLVLSIYAVNPSADQEKIYYINKQNFHQLFEKYKICGNGTASFVGGLLTEMPKDAKLVITDKLSEGETRRLQTELREKHPQIQLLSLAYLMVNELELDQPVIPVLPVELAVSSPFVVLTNDINSAARAIKGATDKVIDISKTTELSDLFENTSLKIEGTGIHKVFFGQKILGFNHESFELLHHLEKGCRVILKGDISSELYHQIETLFSNPPYLIVNGEYREIKGHLILITPYNKDAPHLFDSVATRYKHQFSWDNVPGYLMSNMGISFAEAQQTNDRIKAFYEAAATIKHTGNTTPHELLLTEDRVLQFAEAMKHQYDRKSNPIKQLFHQSYTEDKDNYAQLSIMAKELLSDRHEAYDVDIIKLSRLLQENDGDFADMKWQLFNCFSSSYLRENLRSTLDKVANIEELKRLTLGLRSKIKSIAPRDQRQNQLIHELLKTFSLIELRGTPGTGKTYCITHEISQHENIDAFWGEEKIIDWLSSGSVASLKKQYLLLDEANMKEPGYWDFLKGLKTGEIWYKGKSYPVFAETHKVVFTGNPENYPGRHYHSLLQEVPKVYFKSHTDTYLSEEIIGPLLSQKIGQLSQECRDEITRCFIAAYHLAKKILPFEPIGIRDLKSMLDHLFSFDLADDAVDAQSRACLASIELFAPLFKKETDRLVYIDAIKKQFNVQSIVLENLPECHEGYILPSSRQLLWNNVKHCLARREKSIANNAPLTRVGILVEGPSGIGKSEMMLQALKSEGFLAYDEATHHLANKKVYFHITMGAENISDIILKAFHMGAVVIIDELNLLTQQDEEILTHLFEGRTPAKEDAHQQGFCVLASQNSQLYAGRKPLSFALLSRLDRAYEEPYTDQELIEIALKSAKFFNEIQAKNFVEHFLRQQRVNPENINVRNFFTEIKSMSTQPSNPASKLYSRCRITKMP